MLFAITTYVIYHTPCIIYHTLYMQSMHPISICCFLTRRSHFGPNGNRTAWCSGGRRPLIAVTTTNYVYIHTCINIYIYIYIYMYIYIYIYTHMYRLYAPVQSATSACRLSGAVVSVPVKQICYLLF